MPKAAASDDEEATPDKDPQRASGARQAPYGESETTDEAFAFFRGLMLALLLVVPFWTAVSVAVYLLFF